MLKALVWTALVLVLLVPPLSLAQTTVGPTPQCGQNEEWRNCSSCENGCFTQVLCIDECLPPKCQCLEGYVRHEKQCIAQEDCPIAEQQECKENELWRNCSGCEGTCENPEPACIAVCQDPKCQCVEGTVRHNGQCIKKESCPRKTQKFIWQWPCFFSRRCWPACRPGYRCRCYQPVCVTYPCCPICECIRIFVWDRPVLKIPIPELDVGA